MSNEQSPQVLRQRLIEEVIRANLTGGQMNAAQRAEAAVEAAKVLESYIVGETVEPA